MTDPRARWLLPLLAVLLTLSFAPSPLRADEVTGTWTGAVEAHGNYYLERSTRVIMPDFSVALESPDGVDFKADYLVDVIASASIAQTGSDEDDVFTEYRHQGDASVSYEFGGETPLLLGAGFIYSSENDYTSRTYLLRSALSLWERNTVLAFSGSISDDTIQSNADITFEEKRTAITLNSSIEQVIGPTLVLRLGYSVSYLEGFLANPYRRALKGPLPFPEDHPDQRRRHSAYAKLSWYIPTTDTAVHLSHRAYVDNWDIGAINPQLRIFQQFSDSFVFSAHYRMYLQNAAFFFQEAYAAGFQGFVTNDPKMADHETHTVGARIDWKPEVFRDLGMGFLSNGWVILTFDRYYSTNAFGDAYIATVGGRLAF